MASHNSGFASWVVRQRIPVGVVTLLFILCTSAGIRFLTFDNDNRIFFSKDNPQLKALEQLENTYTESINVHFAIAPKNGNVFTRETLASVEELTERSWQIPFSIRVDSLTNFQHTYVDKDDLLVQDLVRNAKTLTDNDLERIEKIALSEPALINRQVSPSGHVTGVNVTILLPGTSSDEVNEVARFARDVADDVRNRYPGIDIYLSGAIMMDAAFAEISEQDMTTLMPLMFLLLLVITGIAIRSLVGTLVTLAIILSSMLTALGIAGWLGMAMNVASAHAPTIILTLAVADSIHILVTMFHQMNKGKSKHDAIAESLRINILPVFLTSATSAIGFLTMNFSDTPPFRDLGNIVAMGITAAFVYSATLLPALMAILPVRSKTSDVFDNCECDRLADFVIRNRQRIFWATLAIMPVLAAGIVKIDLNDNFVKYFGQRYEIRQAFDFVQDNLTGVDVIEYSFNSGEPGGINNPNYLATVANFADWYRTQPKVSHVDTITDTMKRLNKNMHGNDPAWYRIPDSRELAAQYLLLYEMSLPFGLDLNDRINIDKSATRFIALVNKMTTREQREMDDKAREWLKVNAPPHMFTYGSGISIVWAHISQRNINSMLGASFLALVLISGLLMFALRSFRLGLASLVPNLAPAFMAFGVWGILEGQVGLGLSVTISLTLGIVVDDTVHFISKYLRARREHGISPQNAVRYAFNHVGKAMLVTTVALVAGFMTLAFSGYKMNADMGIMTALTITIALALDFLFLPALLIKVEET